jgi:hypothetical protein
VGLSPGQIILNYFTALFSLTFLRGIMQNQIYIFQQTNDAPIAI